MNHVLRVGALTQGAGISQSNPAPESDEPGVGSQVVDSLIKGTVFFTVTAVAFGVGVLAGAIAAIATVGPEISVANALVPRRFGSQKQQFGAYKAGSLPGES